MPNDETQPCPHCNGTGEVHGSGPRFEGINESLAQALYDSVGTQLTLETEFGGSGTKESRPGSFISGYDVQDGVIVLRVRVPDPTRRQRGGEDMSSINSLLTQIRDQARNVAKHQRTVEQVLKSRDGPAGSCCNKHADNCGCDCFVIAERHETGLELDAGRPPPRRCPTCKQGSQPCGKVYVKGSGWVQCKTCNGSGLLYGLRPEHCGVPGQDSECVECGVRLYGKRVNEVCRYRNTTPVVGRPT
jgi:hypothetical protein